LSRKKAKKGRKGKGKNGRVGQIVQSFLFGDELDDATSARVRELSGLFMIGVSIWLFISLFSFYTPSTTPSPGARTWVGGLVTTWPSNPCTAWGWRPTS